MEALGGREVRDGDGDVVEHPGEATVAGLPDVRKAEVRVSLLGALRTVGRRIDGRLRVGTSLGCASVLSPELRRSELIRESLAEGRGAEWSINGAERSQSVATGGKWDGAENGRERRKPLPRVATGCRDPKMVRRGSTVRVRQRACKKRPANRGSLSSNLTSRYRIRTQFGHQLFPLRARYPCVSTFCT